MVLEIIPVQTNATTGTTTTKAATTKTQKELQSSYEDFILLKILQKYSQSSYNLI